MAFNIGPIDPDCPCKRACPERTPECHGQCERYTEWRKKRDASLVEKNQRQASKDVMSYAKKKAIWRKMRRSRQVRYNKGKEV